MITALKPYPAMKDSGVAWLGEVPGHWDVAPNRAFFDEVKDRNCPDEQMLSVTIKRGVIKQSSLLEDTSKKDSSNLDRSNYKLVQLGDIAYNKMRAWQGAIGVSNYRGIISPAYVVQRLRNGGEPGYFHQLFRIPSFAKEAERWSYGITSDMWSLRPEHFKLIYVCFPSLPEQAAIVRYLDYAEAQVRRFVQTKQKLIALLEEQKQAIVHRSVTRGLNPDTLMKDSGVEWLGEVPAHWEVTRLKSHLRKNDSGVWGDDFSDAGTVVLRSTEQTVTGGWKIISPAKINLSTTEVNSALLKAGDLVVTKSSGSQDHIGKTSLVDGEIESMHCCFSNFMQRLRLDKATNPEFIWRNLNSRVGREQLVFQSTTTTGLGNLNGVILGNCQFAFPPLPEQTAIVNYLDKATAEVDTVIARTRHEIELIHEYRTRLIADVVTGKVDIRDAVTQLPDERDELTTGHENETLSAVDSKPATISPARTSDP